MSLDSSKGPFDNFFISNHGLISLRLKAASSLYHILDSFEKDDITILESCMNVSKKVLLQKIGNHWQEIQELVYTIRELVSQDHSLNPIQKKYILELLENIELILDNITVEKVESSIDNVDIYKTMVSFHMSVFRIMMFLTSIAIDLQLDIMRRNL